MAIIQISRVQHRRGLQEDLPQLASAELGWAIDTRKLYIGNGLTEESAPIIGNTEILTEYSDIFSLGGIYTYKGLAAKYIVQTGPSNLAPSSRSMQDKFDDFANIRDFGGVGDGVLPHDVVNDVEAFNRAITQLYKSAVLGTETRVRRTLYVPAGTYVLFGDFIRLLPYVKLKGDGKNSTFIVQADVGQPCVVAAADSKLQTGVDVGNQTALFPGQLEIEGITLVNQTDNDIVQFNSTTDVLFDGVRMQGSLPYPSTIGTLKSCVNIKSSTAVSNQFTFLNCDFTGTTYALYTDSKTFNVNIIGATFTQLYRGVNLGEANIGDTQPSAIKVSHSLFDSVAREGIYASPTYGGVSNIVSAFNTYKNVGNAQASIPVSPNIMFGGDNCYSIGDTFSRGMTATIPAVNLNGKSSFATLSNGRVQLGKQVTAVANDVTLPDATTTSALAGIVGAGAASTTVEYSLIRATDQRTGVIKISSVGNTIVYDDEYIETADLGIVLTPTLNSGIIELRYTTTAAGFSATLKTSNKTLI